MIIDKDFPVESSRTFYEDELQNKKAMLYQVQKNIYELTKSGENEAIQEYVIDTGQTRQQVKRGDVANKLRELSASESKLMTDIATLEKQLGYRAVKKIVVPFG